MYGILGQQAPRWQVESWFNLPEGQIGIDVYDFKGKTVYLYCFQSWCPGCHKYGFPTLMEMQEQHQEVQFVAVQTVFEGFESNTLERARAVANHYDLKIPFGHDSGPDNNRSAIMKSYRTGGTPWIILIDHNGIVQFNDFHASIDQMNDLIRQIKAGS